MTNQPLAGKPKMTLEQSIGRYFSNEKLSDVCFLVGEKREKLYAHRFLLAIESEVFEAMFHGALKETNYEIPVQDDSPVGFRNMIKYFYTKKVDIDLSEIYETYKTADKYAAMDLTRDLADYLAEKCREIPNVCMILDQLLKLATLIEKSQLSDEASKSLKFLICSGFSNACASASFNEISEDTLVTILNFHMLNISELDLLKACIKWTEHRVLSLKLEANQSNKRMIFEPIKHLIRFGDLSVADFSLLHQQHPLGDYLSVEEVGKLFMFLSQPCYPPPIDCESLRVPAKARVARGRPGKDLSNSSRSLQFSVKCAKKICICSIKTFAISTDTSLGLKIYQDGKPYHDLSSGAKIVSKRDNGYNSWVIDFSQCVLIFEPNTNYQVHFSFPMINPDYGYNQFSLRASQDLTLMSDEGEAVFEINPSSSRSHCIESIDYWSM